jgi:phospholipid/cholesterol/gamma-HCH transport system substrate-binding protein
MMGRATLDLLVGAFVLAGIAAIFFLALKVGNMASYWTSDAYTVHAHFDNIGGLKVRAPVKSSGVVVGRVSTIKFDDDNYEALVSMRIEKQYLFPKDTSASILTSGLIGEQYVGLEAGGETDNLAEGAEIKLTQSAVVLEQLIGQFIYNKAQETPAP